MVKVFISKKDKVAYIKKCKYNRKWQKEHKDEISKQHKVWYKKNRKKRLAYARKYRKEHRAELRLKWKKSYKQRRLEHIKRIYGLTEPTYKNLIKKHNNVCAICKKKSTKNRALCIDHCHISNQIRGLLCDRCNKGIGCFKDSIQNLKNAIKYLKRNKIPKRR